MKLGMFMHPIQDFKRGYHTLLLEDMEIIKYADELGFDEVWLGEHFALPSAPIQSPLMLYAALIAQTKHITFGAGVLCLPYQHPAIVAGLAAQFDHMSEGRFYMGIGPGATPPDFEMFKITDLDRMAMLEESIDMIHGIWATDPPYEFHGKFWDFEIKDNILPDIGVGAMGTPYQDPYPPDMLPAMRRGSSSLRLAARRDWMAISANFVPDEVLKEHWGHYADERQKHGLPVTGEKWRAGRTLLVCDTDEEAQAYLKSPDCAFRWYFEYIIGITRFGGFVHMLKTDPDMPDDDVTIDYCIDTIVTAGSPKTVAEKLAQFRAETGPFETLIISHHDWVHKKLWRRHMELVATEVMPRFRDAIGWDKEAAE